MVTASRRLAVGCEFTYEAEVSTLAIFQVQPDASADFTRRSEAWVLTPQIDLHSYADLYGNQCTRALLPAGWSSVRYEALIDVPDATEDADDSAGEVAPGDLPDDTLIYTLPSRYCLPDVLADEAWSLFGTHPRGYRRVQEICSYVHTHLTFQYGSTTAASTAADVNRSRLGVCRDFTRRSTIDRSAKPPSRPRSPSVPDRWARLGRAGSRTRSGPGC
jgi:transglutaminase-like putative cysteine protease